MLRKALFALFLLIPLRNLALGEEPTVEGKGKVFHSLKDFIKQSDWHLHSRTFLMATVNEGGLKDDIALAQGAGIGLLTKPIKGFQLGLSGYFIFNVASSNIADPDPTTGLNNRYEVGQFDINNPTDRKDLDRLEELFLRYTISKTSFTYGRMELNTPFMNPQDGRMRPTLVEGLWIKVAENEKIGFNGGYIHRVSPRSTVEWYTVGESLGIYPSGLNPDGTRSGYKNNIHSKAFLMGNIWYKPTKNTTVQVWNGYFHHVMNTVLLESRNEVPLQKKGITFYQGLMFIHQDAVKEGGNEDQSKTYISKGAESNAISAQIGLKNTRFNTSLNYTYITQSGRYLMPREWGRDPFYTFMPRERNEGYGNVHAITTNTNIFLHQQRLQVGVGYGYYKLPAVTDARLNKYGFPSYHQLNITSTYRLDNFWKGVEFRLLIASKFKADQSVTDPRFIYNKVNMSNMNLMVDVRI